MLGAVAIALAVAASAQSQRFEGLTAQGQPVSFSATASPRRLLGLSIVVRVRCGRARPVSERRAFRPILVGPDGSFSGVSRGELRGSVPRGDLAWVIGRFTHPGRAEGTVRLVVRRAGASCTSAPIRWEAAAAG